MDITLVELDLVTIINEMFLGYIERKNSGLLYGRADDLPKKLIKLYYRLDPSDRHLDELKENFINHYIECECVLENTHDKFEWDGLKEMYDYIHSDEINNKFDVYTLLELHRKLYSKAPYPDAGGTFRNHNVYLPTTGINLSDCYDIRDEIKALDKEVSELYEFGKYVAKNPDKIFEYIDKCVILKCKLIKIHPFFDGNGRSIRGFINKLFLTAGLPSVYINVDEVWQYKKAMNQANGDGDYSHIISFYYYKICDSIFELDIKPKVYSEIPIGKQVLGLSKLCMQEIGAKGVEKQTWENSSIYVLERYLTSQGIDCKIYSTNHFNLDAINHNFIVVYYKEKGINKRLLLDPVFSILVKEGYVYLDDYSEPIKRIFSNLIENGVTSVSHTYLGQYVRFFKTFEDVCTETSLAVCDSRKKEKVYKKS